MADQMNGTNATARKKNVKVGESDNARQLENNNHHAVLGELPPAAPIHETRRKRVRSFFKSVWTFPGRVIASVREWRRWVKETRAFPKQMEKRLGDVLAIANEYRLAFIDVQYKAHRIDGKAWGDLQSLQDELLRLNHATRGWPLALRPPLALRQLWESWNTVSQDLDELEQFLTLAPSKIHFYNTMRGLRMQRLQEKTLHKENARRIDETIRSFDQALRSLDQLDLQGKVTFNSRLLDLQAAKVNLMQRVNQLIKDEQLDPGKVDRVLNTIRGMETYVRHAPGYGERVSTLEEKFPHLISMHEMVSMSGRKIIPESEIERTEELLQKKIPDYWARGDTRELEKCISAIDNFIAFYKDTVEAELAFSDRRHTKPENEKSMALLPENEALMQVSGFVRSLVEALDARDVYMQGHSVKVSQLALKIASLMNWGYSDLEMLEIAALLHDVGKISIPEYILSKKEPLLEDEWRLIKKHPYYGAQIIRPVPALQQIIPWVYHHQEHWDGNGYPERIAGQNIPLGASIIAVAETYTVLRTRMANRDEYSMEEAIAILQKGAGAQFHPEVVAALMESVRQA